MTAYLDELWQRLQQYKIVEGSRPGLLLPHTPWFVKLVLAISGWAAALFLIAFTVSIFNDLIKSAFASFAFGVILLVLAYYALRDSGEFISQAGFALSLAGQAFVLFAAGTVLNEQFSLTALSASLLAGLLFFVMNGFLHRVYCAFIACIALYLASVFLHLGAPAGHLFGVTHALLLAVYAFIAAWSWLNEFRYPPHHEATQALSWGVSLAVIGIATFATFNGDHLIGREELRVSTLSNRLGEATLGFVLIWTVVAILRRRSITNPKIKIACLVSAAALSLLSFAASGIIIGVLFVLLAYQQQNRVLLGLGFVTLGVYVVRYYYVLEQTLAYKSGVLLLSGIACLVIRIMLRQIGKLAYLDTGATEQ